MQRTGLAEALAERWPSLPFLSLGVWNAWSWLAYSGSVWLSDSEVNGYYLSVLFVISTLAFSLVFLVGTVVARRKGWAGGPSDRLVMASGCLAALGAFLIILIGPFWLGSVVSCDPVFWLGAVLTGVGTAGVGYRCAVLYGGLPIRRILVYAGLSLLAGTFIYFAVMACPEWEPVEHGPAIAGILAFCLLPVGAAALSCVRPSAGSGYNGESRSFTLDVRMLPSTYWRFIGFSFALSLITTLLRSAVVTENALATTVEGNAVIQLLRIAMGILVVVYTVRSDAQGFDLGRVCSIVAVVSAMLVACMAAVGGLSGWLSVIMYFASSIFEFFQWCLLGFVVCQKHVSAVVVFGIGRGAFMLGCTAGWALGLLVVPAIEVAGVQTVFFVVLAGMTLLLWLTLFTEADYQRLFSPVSEDELSLEDLFDAGPDAAGTGEPQAGQPRSEKKGRFSQALDAVAEANALSAREVEVLRYLAMGYGSERTAEVMGVKVNTVRTHTHNVYVKLDVHSREELMKLVDEAVALQ